MNLKISELANKIELGDEVVFFYAGHGVGLDGQNYIVPADIPDTRFWRKELIKDQSIQLNRLIDIIQKKGARITLIILDACRDNPFENKQTGRTIGTSRGLNTVNLQTIGTMVLFSAAANQVAFDSLENLPDNNRNSVFARTLIPLMQQKGLEIRKLARLVRERVYALAKKDNNIQFPAHYDQVLGDYYLAGRSIKVEPKKSSNAINTAKITALKKRLAEVMKRNNQNSARDKETIADLRNKIKKQEQKIAALQKLKNPNTTGKPKQKNKDNKPKPPRVQKTVGINFTHGTEFQDCPECPRMIVVRGDTFTMGSSRHEKGRDIDEGPRRTVRIKKFAVGQYEITLKQFHAFARETNYEYYFDCNKYDDKAELVGGNFRIPGFSQGDDHPVTCVNWNEAKAYVAWLSRKTGKKYRLLTEAEWEYVASAKRSTAFWWGNSISTDQANYDGKFAYNGRKGVYRQRTVAVGSFSKNPFGLYNVHGNVWEWVEDCWHKNYRGAPTDGSAWLSANGGNCERRHLRGGSWSGEPRFLRARYRFRSNRDSRKNDVGFRVARTL